MKTSFLAALFAEIFVERSILLKNTGNTILRMNSFNSL